MTDSMKPGPARRYLSLGRIGRALVYSLQGLRHALRDEAAYQQELILVVVLTVAAIGMPFGPYQGAAGEFEPGNPHCRITEFVNRGIGAQGWCYALYTLI